MAAYVVLMQQVDDTDRYLSEYVPAAVPFPVKHGGEVLPADFDAEAAQGEPPNGAVVLRFPDVAAAWGFLNDPDYQPVKEVRLGCTSGGQMVVVPEFTMPPG